MLYNIARRVLAMSYHFNSPGVGGGGGGGIPPPETSRWYSTNVHQNEPKNHCAESLCPVHLELLEEGIVLSLVVQSLSSAIHRGRVVQSWVKITQG